MKVESYGKKAISYSLILILILLILSSPFARADLRFERTGQNEDFELTSDYCSELANYSSGNLDDPLYGGRGFITEHLSNLTSDVPFKIIGNQNHFLELLSITNDRIESGSNLYFPNDIRIDLSGKFGIVIEENVTMLGSRGIDGKIGTVFHTKNYSDPMNYVEEKPLFLVTGNNVTISSLVFEGPSPIGDIGDFGWKKGRYGIEVNHASNALESNIEISNNEFYGFGHAGISIEKTFTSDIWNSQVRIEHNFIHDNMQFQSGISGTGYGIVINDAFPVIKYNEFGLNRHDVAHTGYFHLENSNYVSGYEFAYNLLHLGATDHLVDVHCYGKENSTSCDDYAGDFVHIHNNLFYDIQVAIAVRGAPTVGACIHANEFVMPESQFIEQKSSQGDFGNILIFDNRFEQLNDIVWADADDDGIGDRSDSDDDNDGVPDFNDAFPLNSSESLDTDFDGIGNNADLDDDNDGVPDSLDKYPNNSSKWENPSHPNSVKAGTVFTELSMFHIGIIVLVSLLMLSFIFKFTTRDYVFFFKSKLQNREEYLSEE